MKPFGVSFATIVIRFYLMMAVVIVSVFSGMYWLTVLALPVFLSAMLGVRLFNSPKKETQATVANKGSKSIQQAA